MLSRERLEELRERRPGSPCAGASDDAFARRGFVSRRRSSRKRGTFGGLGRAGGGSLPQAQVWPELLHVVSSSNPSDNHFSQQGPSWHSGVAASGQRTRKTSGWTVGIEARRGGIVDAPRPAGGDSAYCGRE